MREVLCEINMETDHPDSFSLKTLLTRRYRSSLFAAGVLLFFAYLLEHFANIYAFTYLLRPSSAPVGDIILDNIPVVNLNFIIVEMALIAIVVGALFVLSRPRSVLFTLKAVALFVAIRAVFTSLTHVGIYPDHIVPGLGSFDALYRYLNLQTGLFFSGHTGLPILMALIFWKEKPVRVVLIALSGVFAVAVLLAHVHYSIDVFAAPFMAYGIFKLAQTFFPRDYRLMDQTP